MDPEDVIKRDPDVIIIVARGKSGYESDDIAELTLLRDQIMDRPELANVTAVKDGRVYRRCVPGKMVLPGAFRGP